MDPKLFVPLILQIALMLMIASVGLQAHWRDVLETVRKPHGLLRAVVAVNLVVPLAAVLACLALPIETPIKIGIVIMAVSPLAPLVPGKVLRAGMDASRVTGLYAWLAFLSVVIVPATIALLSAIFPADARVSVFAVGKLLAISVFAPLAFGILVATFAPAIADRLAKAFFLVSSAVLALLSVPLLIVEGREVLSLVGNGAVAAMAAAAGAGIAAGHWLGGPDAINQRSLAFAAATRHPGIAAMIAQSNFNGDRKIMLTIILFLAISVIASTIYQIWLRTRLRNQPVAATG